MQKLKLWWEKLQWKWRYALHLMRRGAYDFRTAWYCAGAHIESLDDANGCSDWRDYSPEESADEELSAAADSI